MSTSGIHSKVQEVKDLTRIERIGAHSHIRGKHKRIKAGFNLFLNRSWSRWLTWTQKDLSGYGWPGKCSRKLSILGYQVYTSVDDSNLSEETNLLLYDRLNAEELLVLSWAWSAKVKSLVELSLLEDSPVLEKPQLRKYFQ